MFKNLLLETSPFKQCLDDEDIYAAAFPGRLVIGRTILNSEAKVVFDPTRAVEVKQPSFSLLLPTMKKARDHLDTNHETEYEVELVPKKKDHIKKLMASYALWDEAFKFSLRYKWNHVRDRNHQQRVRKGLATELDPSKPWQYLKCGISLNSDALGKFLEHADRYTLATYVDYQETQVKKINNFVDHVLDDSPDGLDEKFLAKLPEMNLKERTQWLDSVLNTYLKENPESDDLQALEFRNLVTSREQTVYALFKLRF